MLILGPSTGWGFESKPNASTLDISVFGLFSRAVNGLRFCLRNFIFLIHPISTCHSSANKTPCAIFRCIYPLSHILKYSSTEISYSANNQEPTMSLKSSSKSGANEDVTKHLCAWVNQLSLSDIPDDVRTRAKYLILDGFGCAIVGAHLSWTEKAAGAIFEMESPGNCTVWGYDKVNIQLNTSVNCTLMENTETRATPRSVVEQYRDSGF